MQATTTRELDGSGMMALPMWLERVKERWRNGRFHLFTREMLRHNVKAAHRHGVESACHPQDFVYKFIVTHPGFA